jgi:uncharacterized DUF497 family protein
MEFRWNEWNIEHIGSHGVDPEEAELVVRQAKQPFPLRYPDEKFLVWGLGRGGRFLQVIYILDDDDRAYVIHARPLSEREKRQFRRRRR